MLLVRCLSVCDFGVLWPNGWTNQDETWHAGRPRPWPHCVRWGPSSPPPKGHSPQFSAHICCGQMAAWIKMPLGMDLGLGPGDFCVRWGYRSPSPKRGWNPQISAHVYFGQTSGCIKMPLGMEVGLSLGDFVLDGDPARPLNFWPMFIIVIVISLEHCTVVIGLFKFKF